MQRHREESEQSDLLDLVRVNDRVQLEIAGRVYLTSVRDIRSSVVYLVAPVEQRTVIQLSAGEEVIISVCVGERLRRFRGIGSGVGIEGEPLIAAKDFFDIGPVQSRDFVRTKERLPARFRRQNGPDNAVPWCNGIAGDISRGGVKIISPPYGGLTPGDLVEVEIALPTDDPVRVTGRVVTVNPVPSNGGGMAGYGVQFVGVDPSDRWRIVQHVRIRQADGPKCCPPECL